MLRSDNRIGLGQSLAAVCLCFAMATASHALADEPQAMLGVIPVDEDGQVVIHDAYAGGPADVAGLWPGDRIIAVNDKNVNSVDELLDALAPSGVGTRVEIRASRNGWTKQVQVKLGDRDVVSKMPLASASPTPPPQARRRDVQAETIHSKHRALDSPYYRYRYQRW